MAAHLQHNENVRRSELQRLGQATRLGVDVTTEELGMVRVEAIDRAGALHLKLSSDDIGVRQLLTERSAELRSNLGADGIAVESLGVRGDQPGAGTGGSTPGSDGRATRQPMADNRAQRNDGQRDAPGDDSNGNGNGPGLAAGDGRVDLRI